MSLRFEEVLKLCRSDLNKTWIKDCLIFLPLLSPFQHECWSMDMAYFANFWKLRGDLKDLYLLSNRPKLIGKGGRWEISTSTLAVSKESIHSMNVHYHLHSNWQFSLSFLIWLPSFFGFAFRTQLATLWLSTGVVSNRHNVTPKVRFK